MQNIVLGKKKICKCVLSVINLIELFCKCICVPLHIDGVPYTAELTGGFQLKSHVVTMLPMWPLYSVS